MKIFFSEEYKVSNFPIPKKKFQKTKNLYYMITLNKNKIILSLCKVSE